MYTEYRRVMNQIIYVVFCFLMVLATLSLVAYMQFRGIQETQKNREVGKVNQYYNRVVACLASETPIKRTAEYVKYCYAQAEKATGITGERYGDGR